MVAVATGQHGVVATGQLERFGLASGTITLYARAGRLHRIHNGVYALTPPQLLKPNARRMAAVLAAGPGAALSHATASAHLGLIPSNERTTHVTVPSRGGRSRAGITIHRSSTLRPTDITDVNGIRTTTAHRTLLDLAEHLSQQRLARAIDRAITLNHFDLHALLEQIEHNHARVRGARNLKRALAPINPPPPPTGTSSRSAS